MLSPKPWKLDAIVRLLISLVISSFAGALVMSVVHFAHYGGKAGPKLYPIAIAAFVFMAAALFFLRRKWTFENFSRQMISLLMCFYIGIFLGLWVMQKAWPERPEVPTSEQMLATVLCLQGAAIIFIALFLREHQTGWSEGFGFRNELPKAAMLGILAICVFVPIAKQLQAASAGVIDWAGKHLVHVWPHMHLKVEEQLPVQTLRSTSSWGARIALGVLIVFVVPVAEEVIFRGILYPWIKQRGFPRIALVGTALLFAFIHFNPVAFVPLFVLALMLTGLYEWTNNLAAPIAAHALFNAFNFIILFTVENHPLGQ